MIDQLDVVFAKFREAEVNLLGELQRKRQEFYYEVRKGKVQFTEAAKAHHLTFLKRLACFLRDSNAIALLTAPFIWFCLFPIAFLDLVITIYQVICFPIYRIPKVRRAEFLLCDRQRLAYLNVVEKLNCRYCAYANGILGYATEVAARTEQYWCPIKHALRMKGVHSRYQHFFDYGDAEGYRRGIEEVRRNFTDLESK